MVRLATRKTSTRSSRSPISRSSSLSSRSGETTARKTAAKKTIKRSPAKKAIKRSPAKKAVARKAIAGSPIFALRIKTLLNNLNKFTLLRTKNFGASDPIAKRLRLLQSSIQKELRKSNIINPSLAKSLKSLNPSIRGISNVPKAIRQAPPALSKLLRTHVRGNVIQFLNSVKRLLGPVHTELRKLDTHLNRQLKLAKTGKIQLQVNPSIKKRYTALNNNINKFKIRWGKQLTTLALHGNAQIKTSVKALNNQLDEVQKLLRRNITILNRYAKSTKRKAGHKQHSLVSASQAKALETKFNSIHRELEKAKTQVEHFFDQLKAIKLF